MFPVKRTTFEEDDDKSFAEEICCYSPQTSPSPMEGTDNEMSDAADSNNSLALALPLNTLDIQKPCSSFAVHDEGRQSNKDCSKNSNWSEDVSSHPLLHSLVLSNTFQYLSWNELLKCRSVCTTWDAEVCRLLRKNMTLDFQDICHIKNFKELLDESFLIKPNHDTPFAKINLRSSFRLGHEIAQSFFKTYGRLIKHIKVSKVGCDCGANFFQKLLCYQATNLTSLELEIVSAPIRLSPASEYVDNYTSFGFQPASKHWQLSKSLPPKFKLPNLTRLNLRHQLFYERPRLMQDLLEAAINLEELKTDETSPLFCQNCFIPAVLESRNKFRKLKRMIVGDSLLLSNEQMLKLAALHLRLEDLPLNLNFMVPRCGPLEIGSLMVLLSSLQGSLKRLELFNHRPDIHLNLSSFPQMGKIEFFKVQNLYFPSSIFDKMPQLKIFGTSHEDPAFYSSLFKSEISYHPSVFNFTLFPVATLNLAGNMDLSILTIDNVKRFINELSTAFPYLRTLTVCANDSVLKVIYEKMPLLENLNVFGPISDEGITGVAIDKCRRIYAEKDYGIVDSDELEGLKFIGDLKRLRRLTISDFGYFRTELTEVSVFLGFICCNDLLSLDVGNSELTDLWKQELKRLRGSPEPS